MQTPQGTISGSGDVDLTKQTLDWNLTVANRDRAGKDFATDARRGAQGLDPRIAGAADHPQGGPPDAWRGQLADEPGGTAGLATLTLAENVSTDMINFTPVDLRLYAAAFALAWLMFARALASRLRTRRPWRPTPSGTTLSIASWGGAYGQSQEIAYFEPFTKKTGVKITTETYDGTLAAIKAKIGGSTSPFDIVDLSHCALDMLCRDGLLETIDSAMLTAPSRRTERRARISSPAASLLAASRASPGRP